MLGTSPPITHGPAVLGALTQLSPVPRRNVPVDSYADTVVVGRVGSLGGEGRTSGRGKGGGAESPGREERRGEGDGEKGETEERGGGGTTLWRRRRDGIGGTHRRSDSLVEISNLGVA